MTIHSGSGLVSGLKVHVTIGFIEREYDMAQQPVGGTVEVLPPFSTDKDQWQRMYVKDLLSSQFTASNAKLGTQFYFYKDKGITWRQIDEDTKDK